MIGYQVNNTDLAKTLKFNLSVFQKLSVLYDNGLYVAGALAARLTRERIQSEGTAVDGTRLLTRSRAPIGAYGQRHGKARQLKGLQVAYVDATYTGALMRSFGLLSYKNRTAEIGPNSEEQMQKVEELEVLYGVPIFAPSEQDEDLVIEMFEKEIFGTLLQVFPYT